jgi:hypothetical protein
MGLKLYVLVGMCGQSDQPKYHVCLLQGVGHFSCSVTLRSCKPGDLCSCKLRRRFTPVRPRGSAAGHTGCAEIRSTICRFPLSTLTKIRTGFFAEGQFTQSKLYFFILPKMLTCFIS